MPLLYGYTRNLRSWHHEIEETCPYLSAADKVDKGLANVERCRQAMPKHYLNCLTGGVTISEDETVVTEQTISRNEVDGARPFSPYTHSDSSCGPSKASHVC